MNKDVFPLVRRKSFKNVFSRNNNLAKNTNAIKSCLNYTRMYREITQSIQS